MNVMRVTRYTHIGDTHTWHSRTRKKWVTFTPLGSEPWIWRSRSACLRGANDRYVALHRSCASPRANTGRFKNISFSFFDSAQSKAFVISLLRRRVRRPPLTSERERDISILRKLTRKLNRSNSPSPPRVFIISITIRTVSIGAVPIRGSSKIYTRREITPIITTLLHKFTISRYARYLCVIRRSLNVSRT